MFTPHFFPAKDSRNDRSAMRTIAVTPTFPCLGCNFFFMLSRIFSSSSSNGIPRRVSLSVMAIVYRIKNIRPSIKFYLATA
jgi:hypothetical protein